MNFQRRHLNAKDIIKIASDCASDDEKLKRIKRIDTIQFPSHITYDAESGEYLISIPSEMREELPCLYFFTTNHIFEIHQLFPSPKFSFTKFPEGLEHSRKTIEARVTSALIVSRETMFWIEKNQWEDLTEEQKSVCYPVFVEDNVKYSPM
jgi:hypothetical protein